MVACFPFSSPPLAVSPRFFLFIPLRSLVLGYLNSKFIAWAIDLGWLLFNDSYTDFQSVYKTTNTDKKSK